MSKRRPPTTLYLVKGGLVDRQRGIYRLRDHQPAAPETENCSRDTEWRRLVHSLIRNPVKE